MSDISEAFENINQRITDAAQRSGRRGDAIKLIAVSKKQSLEAIQQLAALGQIDFGESTVQEAQNKVPRHPELNWHCIGHIQSNKTKQIPVLFDWIHSVDSVKLADRIANVAEKENKQVNLLLQVNVAEDSAKYGFSADELFTAIESMLNKQYSSVHLKGLMTIGQRDTPEQSTRKSFSALRQLSEKSADTFGYEYFTELSMGMSQDFELAIEEGATMVRVGAALFGSRPIV